jgi:hypothetical protein
MRSPSEVSEERNEDEYSAVMSPPVSSTVFALSGVMSKSRPTRESVLQRLSEALLRRTLIKVRSRVLARVQ